MKKALLFFFTIQAFVVFGQNNHKAFISERLLAEIEKDPDGWHHIGLQLEDRINVKDMDLQMTAENASIRERHVRVIKALKDKAAATQAPILKKLEGNPLAQQKTINTYWIANSIFLRAKKELIFELAERPDIKGIDLNAKLELVEYIEESCEAAPPPSPGGVEPGLLAINADKMWKMGYTGAGRIAMGADTGIDPFHPSFSSRYMGWYKDAGQTWYEWDPNNTFPSDCDGHGTHTLGTMIGLDRMMDDTIGVAFNANWIGALIICGFSPGTEDNIGSFEWAIDPDGDPNTIDDIPDVINNSWRDPSLQNECESVYVDVLQAMEAVGISVIFSAGNSGPGVSTLTPPHNINYDLVNVFSVGALNANNQNLPIANFSSRGPSICGDTGSLAIKPEVSAPGVSVRSAYPDGEYNLLSGTSMAAPHVAGAILLLREAFPDVLGREIKMALYMSARDLGDPGEDNVFGMGIIDVKAAFDWLVDQGYTPANPYVSNDVMIIKADIREFYCNSTVYPSYLVENMGTDTLRTLDIVMNFPEIPSSQTYTWTGELLPGERTMIQVDGFNLIPGQWDMIVDLENPNSVTDARPYNNRLISEVKVTDRPSIIAYVADHPDGTVCENTRALLRNEFTYPSGNITYEWYDAQAGGNLVGTGQAFLTPPLTESTTYFADALVEFQTAPADTSIGDFAYPPISIGGLRMDVQSDFLLKSFTVYANRTGARTVEIKDINGEVLTSRVFNVNQIGKNVINLDWTIPAGNNLRMELVSGPSLGYSRNGGEFPYELQDVVSITEGTIQSGNNPFFYFYDWRIEQRDICGRTRVDVNVDPGGQAPEPSFTPSVRTVDVLNDPTVMFTNTSIGTGTWNWNFGDGNFSTDENPTHTFTDIGVYIVSLTMTSTDGCTASVIDTITVMDSSSGTKDLVDLSGQVKVFPNPTTGNIFVTTAFTKPEEVNLWIGDMLGRTYRQVNKTVYPGDRFEMNLNDLAPECM
ncbi:MAG: S8 family serine peptidase [Saprospiraceae bacterium]